MGDQSHALFNQKTIDRLCKETKVSNEQNDAIAKWLALLKTGALAKEEKNYIKFALIVLKDILGYDIEGRLRYEEGNVEFSYAHSTTNKTICMEAKGTSTKDLFSKQNRDKPEHETPISQTWSYMGKGNYDYGIATNYRDFVLIDKTEGLSRYHHFDFLSIQGNIARTKEFIAIFSCESLLGTDLVPKLRYESMVEEREFTKEFYKLYHETRLMLIKEFQANSRISKEVAIHYAQLFLNRLIFVFFAEDTDKLKKRLFSESILDSLKIRLVSQSSKYACETIINLFSSLDKGSKQPEIFGFNGGLFSEKTQPHIFFTDLKETSYFDDVLLFSTLKKEMKLDEYAQKVVDRFEDQLNPIIRNLLIMASFDFQSDLNVNILGHIFEQSISDLEELQKEETVSKRKKEAIFYTPQYVTEYICRNTIIPYLSKTGSNSIQKLIEEYSDNIEELERKFQSLRILDPACGSGAFLLEAVDILLEIHREIQIFKESKGRYFISKKSKKLKADVEFYSLIKWNEQEEARKIIEKNIFGVDLNEESIEITKLSLFLKIATTNRKLIDLSSNIRVGNSLIEDPKIAGKKAFYWEDQFESILNSGKFNIIIGNPPYIRVQNMEHSHIDYFFEKFTVAHKKFDISILFYERALSLLSNDGKIGFIASSQWINTDYGEKLRGKLSSAHLYEITNFGSLPVFEKASTYPAIFLLDKKMYDRMKYRRIRSALDLSLPRIQAYPFTEIQIITLGKKSWSFSEFNLENHLEANGVPWEPLTKYGHFYIGALTGQDNVFVVDDAIIEKYKLEKKFLFPYGYRGEEVEPYQNVKPSKMIVYPYTENAAGDSELLGEEQLRSNAPNIYSFLEQSKQSLSKRKDSRKFYAAGRDWFRFLRPGRFKYIKARKLVIRGIAKRSCVGILNEGSAFNGANTPGFILESDDLSYDTFLALLNSNAVTYYLRSVCPAKLKGYFRFNANSLNSIPIPPIEKNDKKELESKVASITRLAEECQSIRLKFLSRIKTNFGSDILADRLYEFYELSFNDVMKYVKKDTKHKLSLSDQDEWETYFEKAKCKYNELRIQIEKTHKEVDDIVYRIYKITTVDRNIIESELAEAGAKDLLSY